MKFTKNILYSIFILSILILIVILLFFDNGNKKFIQYFILILSILLSILHIKYIYKDNNISINNVINYHYTHFLKPIQSTIFKKIKNKTLITKIQEFDELSNNISGSGLFKKNKYKIVVSQDGINSTDIIEQTKKGIDIIINNSKLQKPSSNSLFGKFCQNIINHVNTLMSLNVDVSESINNVLGNNTKFIKSEIEKTNINDLIIMSQSKIFVPINTLNIDIIFKNKYNHEFNLFSLDKDIIPSNFPQRIVDLKTINTNNLSNNNIYLETIMTQNLTNLNNIIDINWINKINYYISNLSKYDIFTLFAYTFKGDNIINYYLRNNKIIDNDLIFMIHSLSSNDTNWTDSYFPYFFQMLKIIKSSNSDNYTSFINQNLSHSLSFFINKLNFFLQKTNLKSSSEFLKLYNDCKDIITKNIDNISEILLFIKNNNSNSINYLLLSLLSCLKYFTNEFWEIIIKQFIFDLDYIIHNAPVLTNYLVCYRGSFKSYLNKNTSNKIDNPIFNNKYSKEGILFKDEGFISTTIDIQNALKFTNELTKCCLQRLILVPGTHCLPISGISYFGIEEKEILLPSSSILFVSNYSNDIPIYMSHQNNTFDNISNICPLDKLKVKTNDLVIISN